MNNQPNYANMGFADKIGDTLRRLVESQLIDDFIQIVLPEIRVLQHSLKINLFTNIWN